MFWCYQHGFHYSCTIDLLSGEHITHIGFTCFKQLVTKERGLRHAIVVLIQQAKKSVNINSEKPKLSAVERNINK